MPVANNISAMRTQGQDLAPRWRRLLGEIIKQTGFEPKTDEVYRTSTWWRSGKIGAVTVQGQIKFKGHTKPAVLKIQGTKPNISEVEQITKFQAQNNSQIIRPPLIYSHLSWDESRQFEAIVFERVEGRKIIASKPTTQSDLSRFFQLYQEYRQNCLSQPWLEKPNHYSYHKQLTQWQEAVKPQADKNEINLSEDQNLVDQAIAVLDKRLTLEQMTFQHGHISTKDLVETEKGQVIILSNLFWGWRHPGYDAVFAYHWHMLGMEYVKDLNLEMLETERDRWLKRIYSLGKEVESDIYRSQINLALLERTLAALLVDRYMLAADPSKPFLAKNEPIIVEFLRGELRRLVTSPQPSP